MSVSSVHLDLVGGRTVLDAVGGRLTEIDASLLRNVDLLATLRYTLSSLSKEN